MIKKSAFFLFLISVTINYGTVSRTPHQVAAIPPLSPPAALQLNMSVHRLSNIIDALIGTTDFTNWTTISSIDPSIFPITATLFAPDANFTLDNSRLTHPDLFSTDSIVIHGIASILDYKVYGDIPDPKSEARNPKTESGVQMTKNTTDVIDATGGTSSLLPLPREEMIRGEQPSCVACLFGNIKAFLVLAWFCLNRSSWIQDLRSAFT